jgi:hypothetical protein
MTYQADPQRYEDRMPYRTCGHSGLKLPSISLGLWHNFGDTTPFQTQRVMLRTAFDLGSTISTWPTTTARPMAALKPILASTCGAISNPTVTSC